MQIDAVSLSGQEFGFERREPESRFQGAIFSPQHLSGRFSREAAICANRSSLDHKVERTFLNSSHASHLMVTRNHGGGSSVGVEVRYSWGGNDNKVEVGVKGEAHDNKGNYVQAEVSQSSKGEGNVSVAGGSDRDRSSSNERSR